MSVNFDVRDNKRWTFSLEALLWIMARSNSLKLKHLNDGLFLTNVSLDWSVVDYCDVFISCLDSHSDGTHSLQRSYW